MTARKPSRQRRLTVALLALCASLAAFPGAAQAAVSTLSFKPVADTWVSFSSPTSSYGTSTTVTIAASSEKQAFLLFDAEGLAGRTVVDARLRMYQTGSSDHGGRVSSISDTGWTESMTWETRPAIDGPLLGSFGHQVVAGSYYEADLGTPALADGTIALALDSPSSDEAQWSSREAGNAKAPRLIVEVESGDSVTDGLSEVAGPAVGSSSPTYYGTQHRLAITGAGRLLAVHGLHSTGVQLAWRDAAGNWQNQTTGSVPDGILLRGTATGDWPASIAVARDSGREQHAWVVFAKAGTAGIGPVYIRRLSDLDSPAGPTVGPLVEVDSPQRGAYKPDIAFERAPSGRRRGTVLWSRRSGEEEYETVAGWLTDLDAEVPKVRKHTVLDSGTGSKRQGTLLTAGGLHALIRSGAGPLALFRHPPKAPLTHWARRPDGIPVSTSSHPSAVGLDSGEIIGVVESDVTNHVIEVQRYSATGAPRPVELTLPGYATPSIASDGVKAWIVMIRQTDGAVVSRGLDPETGWATLDTVEIAPGSGPYAYPNLIRETDGRLRFVVEGFGSAPLTSSVLGFQRGL